MKAAICICTYRRPERLRILLERLQHLEWNDELCIVVADNDYSKREGLGVAQSFSGQSRWPIAAVAVEKNGISYSRNSASNLALQQAADLVAFIDDDEWPEPQWLSELARVQQAFDADAVGGPTRAEFPADAEESLRANPYYGADLGIPDGSRCQLEAAGNFIIKASTLAHYSPDFFDPAFARSGGEDLAFFMRLKANDARMHWASNAIVWEHVPDARMTTEWLKKRVMVIHNSRVHVLRQLEPGLSAALMRGLKTSVLGLQALFMTALAVVKPNVVDAASQLRWKFIGKLTAHLNRKQLRVEGR